MRFESGYIRSPTILPLRRQFWRVNVATLPGSTMLLILALADLELSPGAVAAIVLIGGVSLQVWILFVPWRMLIRAWWRYALLPGVGHSPSITHMVRGAPGPIFRRYLHVDAVGMDLDGAWDSAESEQ